MIGNHLSTSLHNKNVWHYLAERLATSGWNVLTTSSKENQILRLLDMLCTIWNKRHQYEVAQIDVFSSKAFVYANLCSHLLKCLQKKVVLTLHGGGLPELSVRHPLCLKQVLSSADVVVTPSGFIQSSLAEMRNDIKLIPNPIDLSHAEFHLRTNISPNLIWVRAFNHVYNPDLAPKVVKSLETEYPDIKLIMVGPDSRDGSLVRMLALARELSVQNRIEVVGGKPHDDIPSWLSKADIFINTTNYDNMPSSVLEAMACGLPVVSTNVGGIPWLILDGVDGLLVPPDDPVAMANAIRKILIDPDLSASLSENARQKAQMHDWSVILPQWESLLLSVLDKSR